MPAQSIRIASRSHSSPTSPGAYNNYGNALTALGRFDEALAAFDRSLNLRPRYARADYNRGYLLDQLRRFDDAKRSYRQAIECQPDFATPHYQIAHDLIYEEGRFPERLPSWTMESSE